MGEAKRRRALGLGGAHPNGAPARLTVRYVAGPFDTNRADRRYAQYLLREDRRRARAAARLHGDDG